MPGRKSAAGSAVVPGGLRAVRSAGLALAALGLWTSPAAAQFGVVESLFNRVTDISFYASRGALWPHSRQVKAEHGLRGFGVELLFEVDAVKRRVAPPPADSVVLRWNERRITRRGAGADTVDTYEVEKVPDQGLEEVWEFELALGYGQVTGFALRAPGLELHGSVLDLPAITLYATHVASGAYAGLRTGMVQTHALRLYEAGGKVYKASADAFALGGALGWGHEIRGAFPFVEAAWSGRSIPSLEWDAETLPAGAPRELRLSGWSLSAGVQVPIK